MDNQELNITFLSVHNVVNQLTAGVPPDFKPYTLPINLLKLGSCYEDTIGKVETLRSIVYDEIYEHTVSKLDWDLFCLFIKYLRTKCEYGKNGETSILYTDWFAVRDITAIAVTREATIELRYALSAICEWFIDNTQDEDEPHAIEAVLAEYPNILKSLGENADYRTYLASLMRVVGVLHNSICLTQLSDNDNSTLVIGLSEILKD